MENKWNGMKFANGLFFNFIIFLFLFLYLLDHDEIGRNQINLSNC